MNSRSRAVSVRNRSTSWGFVTWEHSFAFTRGLLGLAAFVFSVFAIYYCVSILDAKESRTKKKATSSEIIAAMATMFAILCTPLALLGKHVLISHYIPNKPRKTIKKWRLGTRVATLLITSLTLWGSVEVTPTEDGKEDGVKLLAFLLGSIVLCEAALLDGDNYGVFELTVPVFLMQVSRAFPKLNAFYLYCITVSCYAAKEIVIFGMKQMKNQVARVKGETKRTDVEQLKNLWNDTHGQLRTHHNIDVDNGLPDFMEMRTYINKIEQKEMEEQ